MAYIYPDPSLFEKDFARATTEETASPAPPSPNRQLSTMEQDHPTPAPAAMAPPGRQRRPKEGDSYAKETVRNKARAVEIIKSGQRQDPACDNCKRMGNQCFIDLKISNLCQYCVEKKKVCSANKFGKKSFKLGKTEKQIEDELGNGQHHQQSVIEGIKYDSDNQSPARSQTVQSAEDGMDTTDNNFVAAGPEAQILDLALVRGQAARIISVPAGDYSSFNITIDGMLRIAVLLPENPANMGATIPRDGSSQPLVPIPVLRSVVPGILPEDDE